MAVVNKNELENVENEVELVFAVADNLTAKLVKGWAKGERKTFLESHLESYKAALLVSSDKADKLLDNIVNLWFAKFHWSIPVSQPYLYKPLLIPVGPDGFEILTDEQAQLKKDVIKRMRMSSGFLDRTSPRNDAFDESHDP
ncbi:uncharacterized protein LACBIDRAFT_335683 [Laccaria bicolor S238N-H82]|uniref:Predicted protein n=1 Tax=Laccaria bicolor (strain S238N-H82 / ATCC MYA-4686) TaxID=486041 RepID=B0E321_LACBS|nr:uncharacterized protein LACBIDRAFT_335683 [Laccaria bicolor S238N-H82]EDQ98756.1 predicted protein [Laccaria bicolor S238N-H82]|eukprot:XP_001890588.1 predicted protein [Laccaria bicolor S238N-H82]